MTAAWESIEDGWARSYSRVFRAEVRATGQAYGPLYRWELMGGGAPVGHGWANTSAEAQAAADAAVSRLVATLGREL